MFVDLAKMAALFADLAKMVAIYCAVFSPTCIITRLFFTKQTKKCLGRKYFYELYFQVVDQFGFTIYLIRKYCWP